MDIKLSPSRLNLLEDCPRCFWLSLVKKIKRPTGPIPSIPIKMDSIIKHYFNKYRDLGVLPPIIADQISGKLPLDMPKTLKSEEDNGVVLWGRPDDYLMLEDGNIVAFDHKTKSKIPEGVHNAYQLQLDVYSYLLFANDYKTINKGFLAYYYPDESELHNGMNLGCTIIEVRTNPDRVKPLIEKAYAVLNDEIPDPGENCQYCRWSNVTLNLE